MTQQGAKGLDDVVAVTGATGFVGRAVVRALRRRSWRVRALARDANKAYQALPEAGDGVEVVVGDVFDAEARERLLSGAAAVVHLIGIRRERGADTFERMHVEAVTRLVETAEETGVGRLLHVSALGARPEAPSCYHRSKFAGEMVVRASGLAWTILQPSLILGRGGEFSAMVHGWVTGEAPPRRFLPFFVPEPPAGVDPQWLPRLPGAARVQPLHVDDVAEAVASCLEREQSVGEVYPLGGPEAVTWPDLLRMFHEADPEAKPGLRPRGVGQRFAIRVARIAKRFRLDAALPFTEDDVHMACEDNVCDLSKARAHGVCDPRSLAEAVAQSIPVEEPRRTAA